MERIYKLVMYIIWIWLVEKHLIKLIIYKWKNNTKNTQNTSWNLIYLSDSIHTNLYPQWVMNVLMYCLTFTITCSFQYIKIINLTNNWFFPNHLNTKTNTADFTVLLLIDKISSNLLGIHIFQKSFRPLVFADQWFERSVSIDMVRLDIKLSVVEGGLPADDNTVGQLTFQGQLSWTRQY